MRGRGLFRLAAWTAAAAVGWRAAKRAWLYVQGTRAEQQALPRQSEPSPPQPAEPRDEVDEAIAESFPASDPPSYAGSRGQSHD